MKRKSESVNSKARALFDLIRPAYIHEIPKGYMSVKEIAKANRMSLSGAQHRMAELKQSGLIDVVKVKQLNGKIMHYYGVK